MKEQREMLDAKKIMRGISPKNRSHLSKIDIFDSIDSTNTYLLKHGKEERDRRQSGWVCLAEEQTKGRGRAGREWFSPYACNLYCSLTWSFPPSFEGLSALSLVCGTLLIKALECVGIEKGLGLKWPNDVLFADRKLAGILIENLASSQENWVVIGLGLNCSLPKEKESAWIDLEEILGMKPSRNTVAAYVLNELFEGFNWFASEGLPAFLPLLRQYDLLREKEILVQTPRGEMRGIAQGLSEAGELLVMDKDGQIHPFSYGEVSVRPVLRC